MILVTGGAGFIGSNLVRALNQRGDTDILLVDDLRDGKKALNLADCTIADYLDKDRCLDELERTETLPTGVDCVFHLGACSTTTEWDGHYMMDTNFRFSRALFVACANARVPLVYASSAAVYGGNDTFVESPQWERPLNVYGYSKLAFDQFVRARRAGLESPVVGLRYFNVYGPREQHKGAMASVVWHLHQQLLDTGVVRLFEGSHGFADGEQQRDFIHVDDAVAVTLWCAGLAPAQSGIYNCGTGIAASFNSVAQAIIGHHGRGEVAYIGFPSHLHDAYQAYTCADLTALRALGWQQTFKPVATGVQEYLSWLAS